MSILEGRMYAPPRLARPGRSWIALPVMAALLTTLAIGLAMVDATLAKASETPAVAAPSVASPAHDDGAWAADESRYGSRPDYAH